MSISQKYLRKVTFTRLIGIIALLISIIALIVSIRANGLTQEANKIAKEALNEANEANDISSGRTRILPSIRVADYPIGLVNIKSLSNIQNSDLDILLLNSGDVPIDFISFEIIGISGLSFSYNYPDYDFSGLGSIKKNVELDSQLESNGYVSIDMQKPILEFLGNIILPDNHSIYRITLNLVFLPRRFGESKPIQTPGNAKNDRQLITLEFIPEILDTEEIRNILSNNIIQYNIWNYADSTEIP